MLFLVTKRGVRARAVRCVLGAALLLTLPLGAARAATITFDLDTVISGTAPVGATPWMTATLDDSFGGSDTVRLTLSTTNLTGGSGGESLALFFLNFDPILAPTQLSFTVFDESGALEADTTISTGVNAFMADGDGEYDIQFDFPPPPGQGDARFTGGETVAYDMTYGLGDIDVSSFNFLSEEGGGQGNFLVAGHVQRINGESSGWIGTPIPEPETGILLGLGLFGLAALGGRSR